MEDRSLFDISSEESLAALRELATEDNAEGKEAQEILDSLELKSAEEADRARILESSESFVDTFQRDIMDPFRSPMSVFGGSHSHLVPNDIAGTAAGKSLGAIERSLFAPELSGESKFVRNLRDRIDPFLDISSDRLLHGSTERFVANDILLKRADQVTDLLSQENLVNAGGALFRPGILPTVKMIHEADFFIDIDIFQLQNQAVVETLLGKAMDAKRKGQFLKINVQMASVWSGDGDVDATGVQILSPNRAVSGALRKLAEALSNSNIPDQALFDWGDSNSVEVVVVDAKTRSHQ